jgi:hypothetical protein
MALRLNAARSVLRGYGRTLVDGLFFDGRSETTTDLVKEHYGDTGYDPAKAIGPELGQAAQRFLPAGDAPRAIQTVRFALVSHGPRAHRHRLVPR